VTDAAVPAKRGRGRPGYDKATVVHRAIELFNLQGYEATSINDLATALGLSKSAIFHHVGSKEELLGEALDEALEGLEAVIRRARSRRGSTSAEDRLRTAVAESVRVLIDHLPAVTLLLRVRGNSAVEVQALARRRKIDDALAALVRAAMTEGSVRRDLPPAVVSRLVFGMVNSLTEWYRPDGPVDRDALAVALTHLAFDGLTLPQTGPRGSR
jgi:AcrR family transcriptional regulator